MQQLEALPGLIRVGKVSKPDIGRLALAIEVMLDSIGQSSW